MVGTIGLPIVDGAERSRRPVRALAVHVLGSGAGGAAAGFALAAVGWTLGRTSPTVPPDHSTGVVLLAVASAVALRASGLARFPLPQIPRQVPASWRFRYPRTRLAFFYGLGLGPGITTHVRSAAMGLVVAFCVLTGSINAVTAFVLFGVARALTTAVIALSASTTEQASIRTKALVPWERRVARAEGFFLATFVGMAGYGMVF